MQLPGDARSSTGDSSPQAVSGAFQESPGAGEVEEVGSEGQDAQEHGDLAEVQGQLGAGDRGSF